MSTSYEAPNPLIFTIILFLPFSMVIFNAFELDPRQLVSFLLAYKLPKNMVPLYPSL
jgi:hypothetical protein